MYYSELKTSLVGTDTNICAMIEMDSIEPIVHGLRVIGGYVILNSMMLNNEAMYNMRYWSPDNRISISVPLDKSEYLHNLEFFGQDRNLYDDPIEFIANGKKFQMP